MARFPKQPTLLIRTVKSSPLLGGLIDECDKLGWRVMNIAYGGDYIPSEDKPVGAIIESEPSGPVIARLREMGIPIVRVWRAVQSGFDADACVMEDRRAAGRIAADAFAERGFKEFGYITFQRGVEDELFVGFRERARKTRGASVHVRDLDLQLLRGSSRYERSVEIVAAWLTELPKPLALLSFNFSMATRNLAACERAGLSVPEEVAIACRGNDEELCRTSLVPMSAIDMNTAELGRQAVQMVKRLASGKCPPRKPLLVPVKGFVERRSTDILAVSDPTVAKAMRFIWDHLRRPLSIEDIAREVNSSRATLARAFSRTLGRGINGELRRKRLEVCKELLRTTKMPLEAIAKAVGLTSRRHLHRAFKDAFEMTPREYRLRERAGGSKRNG